MRGLVLRTCQCHSADWGEGDECSNTNICFLTKNMFNESAALCKLYLPCQNSLYLDECAVAFLTAECWVDCLWQSEVIHSHWYFCIQDQMRSRWDLDSDIPFLVPSALEISLKSLVPWSLIITQSRVSSAITLFAKSFFFPPTVHYKYETVPCIFMLWTTAHNFPSKHLLQPENQLNPKNIRALIHNQVINVRSITVTRFRLLNWRTGHLSPYMLNMFVKIYYSLHSLNRASWHAYVRKTNEMHTFLNNLFHLIYPPHIPNK